jgi:aminoglycoside 3'-phosphotransferase I
MAQRNTGGMTFEHDPRETSASPQAVPPSLDALIRDHVWTRDLVGESGCTVYRLSRAGFPDLYLKHGQGAAAAMVQDETDRLQWMAERLAVPAVHHAVTINDNTWLLMTALPGKTAYQLLSDMPDQRETIVRQLALFLKSLHAVPAAACPFDSTHTLRLALARTRLEAGLVDTEDFDDARAGWTAEQVWAEMQDLLPLPSERVVTHGDFSLDNILLADGHITGCIDVGRLGIADPYQDLAILWNCLGAFDTALQDQLFRDYGITDIDHQRLQFHLMLDEFF